MKYCSILLLLVLAFQLHAQVTDDQFILSREGRRLQKKNILIGHCVQDYAADMQNKTVYNLCVCQISLLDRRYSESQIRVYTKKYGEEGFGYMIKEDTDLQQRLKECQNSVGKEKIFSVPVYRQGFVKNCVDHFRRNTGTAQAGDTALIQFCSCAADVLQQRNIEVQRFEELSDPSSFLYNEVAYKCGSPFIKAGDYTRPWQPSDSNDIVGPSIDTIRLLSFWGMHKLKVNFGGITKIWLLDSGASDLLISESYGNELLAKGLLSSVNFIGDGEYTLADNRQITCKRYRVNQVRLGKYSINNVIIAVSKQAGELLFGKSVLNKFSQWTLDNKNDALILKK